MIWTEIHTSYLQFILELGSRSSTVKFKLKINPNESSWLINTDKRKDKERIIITNKPKEHNDWYQWGGTSFGGPLTVEFKKPYRLQGGAGREDKDIARSARELSLNKTKKRYKIVSTTLDACPLLFTNALRTEQ